MTVTAQSVLKHVSIDVLVDATNKKWAIAQLVRDLNRIQQLPGSSGPSSSSKSAPTHLPPVCARRFLRGT
jgi:hypothetical protein